MARGPATAGDERAGRDARDLPAAARAGSRPASSATSRGRCEPRPREPVIPPRSDPQQATGRLILQDVYAGRRMEGVSRGEIKKLLVLETLPKPINYSGKMPPMSFGGTYTLERVLGTVPVEPDGSAYMEAARPAQRCSSSPWTRTTTRSNGCTAS